MKTLRAIIWPVIMISCLAHSKLAMGNGWQEFDGITDADAAGKEIAEKLAIALKKERSNTVILEQRPCPSAQNWCQSLSSSIERVLIAKGIQFLPEEQRNVIREKIAEEGLYQQSSELVDASKAVEIGKQEAVQAFVSISVSFDTEDKVMVEAQSIRVSSGTVTIKKSLRLTRKKELSTPLGNYFKGIMWAGIGLGVASVGFQQSRLYKKKSDDSYALYSQTKDPGEAKKYRSETEEYESRRNASGVVTGIGICISLYGLTRFSADQSEQSYYRLDSISDARSHGFSIDALVSNERAGFSWSYHF